MGAILAICTILGGISAVWYFRDKIVAWFQRPPPKTPELQVGRQLADEIGLPKYLENKHERLFWGDVSKEQYYLQFGDYERIMWTDIDNKTWLLCAVAGEDLPSKSRFSSEEIERRRKDRAAKTR